MQSKLVIFAAAVMALLLIPALAMSSQQVRVEQNVESIAPDFNVAQRATGVDMTVGIPAIAITNLTVNSTPYQKVDLPIAEHLDQAEIAVEGMPDVPVYTTMLAIPDQAGIQLNITNSGFDVFENIDLAPVQPSPSDVEPNATIPFTIDQNTYNTDAFYPGELASASEPVIMRDVRGVQIQVNPVQYNPVRHELRVYRDLSVSVSYAGEPINPKTVSHPYLSEGFLPLYKTLFANFDQMLSNVEVKRGGYMIICKASLVDSLKALAMWKHQKGYASRIVPTTEILPSGSPTSTQIFNFIKNAYLTWQDPPEYVMLVGDMDGPLVVPCYPYSSYPSDNKYSCVDGTDFIPDIFVARLSVDYMSELRVAVSKIFKYEKTPLMRDPQHWIRGFAAGYTMFSTARFTTLWVREMALRKGFAQVDTVYGSSHDARVVTVMNTGPAYIWYRGEGGDQGWWGVDYSVSDLTAMPNHQKLGVCSPLTCGLGDFSANECFGETWIRMGLSPDSLKGGPAFYGVSDHFTHTKWNNPIMIGYFFGMFEQDLYHFGQAAIAGKLQDYRTFPRNISGQVQQYFNTYNMQGDPELELRMKIPIFINVTHEDTLAFGLNHIEVNVIDTSHNPVEGAYVTLVKMNGVSEELYSIGKTDANGNIELSFNALTPGAMTLTVSGRDLYPYQGQVVLVNSSIAVGYDSLSIDDDMLGYSIGNGDTLINPDETIELYIDLKNYGSETAANGVITNLTSLDESVAEVLDGNRTYGNIAPGARHTNEKPFIVRINPNAQDGDIVRLKLDVTDQSSDNWFSVLETPIKAAKFIISRIAIQDVNNRMDPGDTVNMVLTIKNTGHTNAMGVTASIGSDDDYISILDGNTNFGDILIGDSATSTADSIILAVDASAFAGRKVNFSLNTTTAIGAKSSIGFTVTVDSVLVATDPTAPDAYGYYLYDKTDTTYESHPTYSWVELVPGLGGQGTRLNYGSNTDDKSVLVNLPFDFVYYGVPYRPIIVCTNGFISPDTDRFDQAGDYWADFFNWPIPDPGNCRGQISPFWDDLQVTSSGNYGVFTWSDTANHRYVIEWAHATQRNTNAVETFEIIIYDPVYYPTLTGDAEIVFQYNSILNNDTDENYATVGIESWDQLTGIQYTHDNYYTSGSATITATGFAIKATTNNGRGGISGIVDLGTGGLNGNVQLSTVTGQHRYTSTAGDYWLRSVPPGLTSITAQIDGYFPETIDSVNVLANQTIDSVNFDLTPCPIPQNLTATDSLSNRVEIHWTAVTNPNLDGYNVYRSRWQYGAFTKINSALITGTIYTDSSMIDSGLYWYYVTSTYSDSTLWQVESFISNKDWGHRGSVGAIDNGTLIPQEFFLAQNYPNPFNPTTTISYGLPKSTHVKLDIFNIIGQKTVSLIDGDQEAGVKKVIWNGRDQNGQQVASGMYFYRLRTGDKEIVRKMSLIK
jgi:hypothetical protein